MNELIFKRNKGDAKIYMCLLCGREIIQSKNKKEIWCVYCGKSEIRDRIRGIRKDPYKQWKKF